MWTILILILILWALGFFSGVGGSFIHLILVIAFVIVLVNFVRGRDDVI